MTVSSVETRESWRVTAGTALRRLAAVTCAGGLLGLLVGGVGGRLAMMLLARLNPDFTGVTSDDGFSIGQLTPSTFNLLAVATLLGVVGGGVYFVVRWLMFGPRWWQVLSIAVGPAVVVGSMLVHRDGVDFTLQPVWLAVALFAAIPGVYAALLTVLAERWLAPRARFATAPLWLAVCPLLLWVPILPALGALLLGLLVLEAVRRTRRGGTVLEHPGWPWLGRGALVLVFAVALVDLVGDTVALT